MEFNMLWEQCITGFMFELLFLMMEKRESFEVFSLRLHITISSTKNIKQNFIFSPDSALDAIIPNYPYYYCNPSFKLT